MNTFSDLRYPQAEYLTISPPPPYRSKPYGFRVLVPSKHHTVVQALSAGKPTHASSESASVIFAYRDTFSSTDKGGHRRDDGF